MHPRAIEILIEARQKIQDPPMRGKNPHFKSNYALLVDVRDVIDAVLRPLKATLVTVPVVRESGVEEMEARLFFATDDSWEMETLATMKMFGTDPQKQGSAQTYARRYLSCAAMNIIGETDDDGNAASLAPEYREAINNLVKSGKATRDEIKAVVQALTGIDNPVKVKEAMQQQVLDALTEKFGKAE